MSMKNPLTPAGIEPAAFRFVAQRLNHCATVVAVLYTASKTCLPLGPGAGYLQFNTSFI